jgi:hypothetical protein
MGREFPAAAPEDAHWTDRTVKQGHADYCAQWGHATWTVDGADMGRCPRCGDSTAAPAPATHLAVGQRVTFYGAGNPTAPFIGTIEHLGPVVATLTDTGMGSVLVTVDELNRWNPAPTA